MAFQKPKILYDNRFADANPVASTTAAGYNVLNLRDWRPYTWWQPTALPATVTVDCLIARAADYALLWGHSLHDAQASIQVRGSTDNFASSDVLVASSNLVRYPQEFINAAWFKTDSTATINTALAPDGTLTADKITATSITDPGVGQVINIGSAVGGITFIFSVWLWTDSGQPTFAELIFYNSGGVTSVGSVVISLPTTPTRFSLTHTFPAGISETQVTCRVDLAQASNSGVVGEYLYAWGAQVQVGATLGQYEIRGNKPILLTFNSASYRYWRWRVNGDSVPSLAIAALGAALEVPEYLPEGFDPLNRKIEGDFNRTNKGHPLGRAIEFEEWSARLDFDWVTWSWVRNSFKRAWDAHLRASPFVFAWDAGDHADEIYLVNTKGEYKAAHKPGSYASLSIDVSGVVP